jgi:NosR/NirI family nitrous oxide reductase transcriptional regulator
MRSRIIVGWLALILCCLSLSAPAQAAGFGAYTAEVQNAEIFPGAEGFGPVDGKPPAIAAYRGDKVIGYIFETSDIGYSGKPIRIKAGLDTSGILVKAKVVEHHEPILLVGIPSEKLFDFVERYAGRNIVEASAAGASKKLDAISGATVTAVVINDGLTRAALALARSRGIGGGTATAAPTAASLAHVPFEHATWAKLADNGLIRRLHLSNAEVDAAFLKIGVGSPEPYAKAGVPTEDFIDLYLGLFSVETIGRSLLSTEDYSAISSWLKPGDNALFIAGRGDYSFRGSGYVRGGIFDRIQLVQGETTILFKDRDQRRIDKLATTDAPDLSEIGVFRIPADSMFDPAKPLRLELLAQRPTGPIEKAFTSFSLPYELPSRFLKAEAPAAAQPATPPSPDATASEAPPSQLWRAIWESRAVDLAILAFALALLTLIFFFQDWLVRRPVLFGRLRAGYLLFSVLWLGLYDKAQLSVVNVFTFAGALRASFHWSFFLLEPLIFVLWCATAVSLLFWGRGAYCGWLCPFGALQELANHAARRLGVPQKRLPFYIHERLWAMKYILFLVLFGVSLDNVAFAEQLAEIEPFKTVVLLRFMREWWFVGFALSLLVAGLFIERFYCRYLCVLGAALAIPGRSRMFNWLKRRKQCGFECQLCANNCMVQAIHPMGEINPHECLYCMHCQVIYWDDHVCPPLVMKREGRGKKPGVSKLQTTVANPEAAGGLKRTSNSNQGD